MKFAPTFKYSLEDSCVIMTIYNDNGTVFEHKPVDRKYEYAVMYFKLIKRNKHNPYKTLTKWNTWWNNGKLDGFKYDLI